MSYFPTIPDGTVIPYNSALKGNNFSVKFNFDTDMKGYTLNGIKITGNELLTSLSYENPKLILKSPDGQIIEKSEYRFVPELYKKFRFTIDDNIRFLEDININKDVYTDIFQNPYLNGLLNLHKKYGLKVTLNLFYSYYPDSFNLSQMTSKFKSQFENCSDWLRFSFHARHNDPPNPYENTDSQVISKDFDDVIREIIRFAGEKSISDFMTVHYFRCTKQSCLALKNKGVRGFMGRVGKRNGIPTFACHLKNEDASKMDKISLLFDKENDLYFINNDMIINLFNLDEIIPRLKEREKLYSDFFIDSEKPYFDVMIHEQYFYPDFNLYQPDFFLKLETVFKYLFNKGFESVFLDDIL